MWSLAWGPFLIPGLKFDNIPNIKGLGLLVLDKKIFLRLPIGVYVKKLPLHKKVKVSYSFFVVVSFFNLIGSMSQMLDTKPQGHWSYGSREEDF